MDIKRRGIQLLNFVLLAKPDLNYLSRPLSMSFHHLTTPVGGTLQIFERSTNPETFHSQINFEFEYKIQYALKLIQIQLLNDAIKVYGEKSYLFCRVRIECKIRFSDENGNIISNYCTTKY